jgi:hypothetical protein
MISSNKYLFKFESIGTQWEIETNEKLDPRLQQRIGNRRSQSEKHLCIVHQ